MNRPLWAENTISGGMTAGRVTERILSHTPRKMRRVSQASTQELNMPQVFQVGHRSLLSSISAKLLQWLGREPQAWPPRQRVTRSLLG